MKERREQREPVDLRHAQAGSRWVTRDGFTASLSRTHEEEVDGGTRAIWIGKVTVTGEVVNTWDMEGKDAEGYRPWDITAPARHPGEKPISQ